jgi:hypothetical protein
MNPLKILFPHKPDVQVGLWSADFNYGRKEFQIVFDCPKCQQQFPWPVSIARIYQPLDLHVRHCKRDEKIPAEFVKRMQAYIARRRREDPSFTSGSTWEDIEREGKRIF